MTKDFIAAVILSAAGMLTGAVHGVAPQAKKASTKCEPQLAPMGTGSSVGSSDLPVWRKEEAEPWRGDGWLGWNADGETLAPVRLIVRDSPTSTTDYPELTVETTPPVDYAVRCISGLRNGPIRSVSGHASLTYDGPLALSVGDRRYVIRVESKREDLADARVVLAEGNRTQVLYSADGFTDDPHYFVEWAGDLDRDGKLDLIVNLHRKYSWHPYRLLLSSKASASQLVGQAAIFETGD